MIMPSNCGQPCLDDQDHDKKHNAAANHQLRYLEILNHPSAFELQDVDDVQPDNAVQYELGAEK